MAISDRPQSQWKTTGTQVEKLSLHSLVFCLSLWFSGLSIMTNSQQVLLVCHSPVICISIWIPHIAHNLLLNSYFCIHAFLFGSTFTPSLPHLRCDLVFPLLSVHHLDLCHGICLLPYFAPGPRPSPAVSASSQHGSSVDPDPQTLWPAGRYRYRFICDRYLFIFNRTFSQTSGLYSRKRDTNNFLFQTEGEFRGNSHCSHSTEYELNCKMTSLTHFKLLKPVSIKSICMISFSNMRCDWRHLGAVCFLPKKWHCLFFLHSLHSHCVCQVSYKLLGQLKQELQILTSALFPQFSMFRFLISPYSQ